MRTTAEWENTDVGIHWLAVMKYVLALGPRIIVTHMDVLLVRFCLLEYFSNLLLWFFFSAERHQRNLKLGRWYLYSPACFLFIVYFSNRPHPTCWCQLQLFPPSPTAKPFPLLLHSPLPYLILSFITAWQASVSLQKWDTHTVVCWYAGKAVILNWDEKDCRASEREKKVFAYASLSSAFGSATFHLLSISPLWSALSK